MARREKGTYGTLGNWVLTSAPRLPVAAGWVLMALENQSNYDQKGMSIAALCEATGREGDQVRRGLALLVEFGAATQQGRSYLIGTPTRMPELLESLEGRKEKAVKSRTSARSYARKDDLISDLLKEKTGTVSTPSETAKTTAPEGIEGLEGLERQEEKNNKAQNSAAPVEASPSQESVLETNTPAAVRSDAPALEKVPRRRAAPAEMPEMPADLAALPGLPAAWAEWLTYRKQRRLSTAPATASGMFVKLREFATEGLDPVGVIRNSIAQGYQGLFPAKAHIVRFNPAARTTEEANDRVRNRARELYNASKETRRAVF